jgi:hypothetical protein
MDISYKACYYTSIWELDMNALSLYTLKYIYIHMNIYPYI